MKTLHFSTQFKKDFKRYRNNPVKLSKLNDVFRMLENEQKLPKSLFPHKLHGKYKDCIECHIEDDFSLDLDRRECHRNSSTWHTPRIIRKIRTTNT